MNTKKSFHEPVLLKEVIEHLQIKPGKLYIDATIGGGGHGVEILKLGGRLLGIDCDPEAIKAAGKRFSTACPPAKNSRSEYLGGPNASWQLAQENFVHLKIIAEEHGFKPVAGIILDLGVSSHQLETVGRGFSFRACGPLDMRMDPGLSVTAADLINGLGKRELNELFSKLGEERYSWKVAQAIECARRIAPIKTCLKLVQIIEKVVPARARNGRLHPATRIFLALRMAVNDELNNLKKVLPQAIELLDKGGRLIVISFHSGEDRIVKHFFKQADIAGSWTIITKKPVQPSLVEVRINPRSRSAKMRVIEKI